MKVKINNSPEMSIEEAQSKVSDFDKIDSISFTKEGKKSGEINMSGTDIPKEFLISAILKMRKIKATEATLFLENCRNLGGVDIEITIRDKGVEK